MSDTPFRFPNRLQVTARPGSPFPLVELVRDIPTPLQYATSLDGLFGAIHGVPQDEIGKEVADA